MSTDIVANIERAIELCLSRAGALQTPQPERDALVYEVTHLRRLAEIVSGKRPEPLKSHVIAVSTRVRNCIVGGDCCSRFGKAWIALTDCS